MTSKLTLYTMDYFNAWVHLQSPFCLWAALLFDFVQSQDSGHINLNICLAVSFGSEKKGTFVFHNEARKAWGAHRTKWLDLHMDEQCLQKRSLILSCHDDVRPKENSFRFEEVTKWPLKILCLSHDYSQAIYCFSKSLYFQVIHL